ncbi:hypothetical protein SESBI_06403 [Sesbania bispinosa]|nr:hypothetical protein SESBI_06403 [Sesbania bispinosa]
MTGGIAQRVVNRRSVKKLMEISSRLVEELVTKVDKLDIQMVKVVNASETLTDIVVRRKNTENPYQPPPNLISHSLPNFPFAIKNDGPKSVETETIIRKFFQDECNRVVQLSKSGVNGFKKVVTDLSGKKLFSPAYSEGKPNPIIGPSMPKALSSMFNPKSPLQLCREEIEVASYIFCEEIDNLDARNDCGVFVAMWMNQQGTNGYRLKVDEGNGLMLGLELSMHPFNKSKNVVMERAKDFVKEIEDIS